MNQVASGGFRPAFQKITMATQLHDGAPIKAPSALLALTELSRAIA